MRIRRLLVKDFAGIREADIELGDGLNVLYGPNDLGKSTLADAIRLALLLPHTSSHVDEYVSWTGGQTPVVELTFQTEPQRFWKVRKEFRKGGDSFLWESKDNQQFDEVEKARKVDGRLRELLRWGIPEPGGSGGSKGLPSSFLATVLLSTQSDVSAILADSLQGDPSDTGKERIAAALQAVAQDPLFVALLRDTQARRDAAYTEKGARKTAKGSVFKDASDRLKEARDEKERLQQLVEDSESVEHQLRDLTLKRDQRDFAVVDAMDRTKALEVLAAQADALAIAEDRVQVARDEVERIRNIGTEAETADRAVGVLATGVSQAEEALQTARERLKDAEAAYKSAEEAARAAGTDSGTTGTVARQSLEIRRGEAERAARDAQEQIDRAFAAQGLADGARVAEAEHRRCEADADRTRALLSDAAATEQATVERILQLDLLEQAVESQLANERRTAALADVDREASLRAQHESLTRELERLVSRRAAITVPTLAALAPMRRLANDLAGARGALNVGLVVTVKPKRPLDMRVRKDGTTADVTAISEPHEIEAGAEIDLDLPDIATVQIRGGRREAQHTLRSLEQRWEHEVEPHLAAAKVNDLDGLSARLEEARALDASIAAMRAELKSLGEQIASFAGAAETLRETSERATKAHDALGGIPLNTLASDLTELGADATGGLRKRRQQVSAEAENARVKASQAGTDHALAEERRRSSKVAIDAALVARDAALAKFPDGAAKALSSAQAGLASAEEQERRIATELTELESRIAAETARFEAAIGKTRLAVEQAKAALEAAQQAHTSRIAEHASQVGRLEELRKLRDSQDLAGAERRLREATDRHAAVPVPERMVAAEELTEARNAEARAKSDLERIVHEIQRAHGALEQVGGAVARERLRDAIEAFEAAERREREVEAEYDAWLLLLQQMKEADAAQASNLGQTMAPAIAGRFEELTTKRYEDVRLTAQLGTEGVVVSGALRPTERISVGTREQLSTLYRLALAEYLKTAVVLDDQLVQSDGTRMDWFRALLSEKARGFQIIVFTCRPGDYLAAGAMVAKGKAISRDTDGGFTRAVDLGRAIQRK